MNRLFFLRAGRWALLAAALLAAPLGASEQHRPNPSGTAPRPELGSAAAFDGQNRLLVATKEGGHVVLRVSLDEGRTWSEPTKVNSVPEMIAADGESRPKIALASDGGILVTWAKPLAKPYTSDIRLARSNDGGLTFDPPITVHHDRSEITHRFESLVAGKDGRVTVVWIDKRDLEDAKRAGKQPYRGTALYAAISDDGGRSFRPESKIADHSCECCRTALALDADGTPLAFWRHVFAPNERDHAFARLKPDGTPEAVQRATFEGWKIDACPHHGPSLAVDGEGTRHAVWFNQKDGEGHVYYGRLQPRGGNIAVEGQRTVGGPQASHADLAAAGRRLAIVWKEFDGEETRLHALVSSDGGLNFTARDLGATAGASDHPHAILKGDALYAFWHTEKEGFRLYRLP